jgi:peptidoglycan-N-acetylmuramic acid deacetylase
MKKALLILCFACVIASSGIAVGAASSPSGTPVEGQSVRRVSYLDFPFNDKKPVMSDEEILKLNTQKCGFGQGLRLDEKNRPYCSLDFNSQFEKYDALAIAEDDNTIYLTFDQGYENGCTAKILDTLKEKNIKATFFVLDDYVKRNPELVGRMIEEGHTIGNHSVHHYSMPTLDINTAKKEISELHEYILEEYGYNMTLFRPPMGEFSEQSLAVTQACGYKTVMWSFAYADWDPDKQMDTSRALEKVSSAAHSGCIYLLHSVSKTNCEILPKLIDNLVAEGYSFSVPE